MDETAIGETRTLYPGKLKWGFVSLIMLTMAGFGIFFLISEGADSGYKPWIAAIFGSLGLIISLVQIFGKLSSLTLTSEGFKVRNMGREKDLVRWQDCLGFGVASIRRNKMIIYDHVQDIETLQGKVSIGLVGASSSLPDTYGMKPQALAALMNAYRAKALAGS